MEVQVFPITVRLTGFLGFLFALLFACMRAAQTSAQLDEARAETAAADAKAAFFRSKTANFQAEPSTSQVTEAPKSPTDVQSLISTTPSLSDLDAQVSNLFDRTSAALPPATASVVQSEQAEWEKHLNTCSDASDPSACIATMLADRSQKLSALLNDIRLSNSSGLSSTDAAQPQNAANCIGAMSKLPEHTFWLLLGDKPAAQVHVIANLIIELDQITRAQEMITQDGACHFLVVHYLAEADKSAVIDRALGVLSSNGFGYLRL